MKLDQVNCIIIKLAEVVKVVDGDTIDANCRSGF